MAIKAVSQAPEARPVSTGLSLLEQTIRVFVADCPLKLSFEDLSGIRIDVPELNLGADYCVHTCDFCMQAKSTPLSHQDCIRNKLATNRLARRRLSGFHGQCHLGLTDIVEPLVFHQRCLGVFYFGSIVVEETEREARKRILAYCRRRKLDSAPFLFEFKRAPRISSSAVPVYQERLRTLTAIAVKILEAYGLPLERYRTEMGNQFTSSHRIPVLIQGAMRYIHRNYQEAMRIGDVASYLKCNQDYLSRMLNKHLGVGFSEYLLRVRIDHARHLLQNNRYGAGEVGYQVGFSDQSYFGKVFKQRTGLTPIEYRNPELRLKREKQIYLETQEKLESPNLSRFRSL